ncbi:helix-turn-helix domain-containing protein [Paenibacillus segetis]|uniref:XRE family transcriptional regulator n=1 Tax=Paenibacillus segetis TaxID=1325360 RepID=A0ABQ1YBE3_9BACL|nr:RodZ family helix-turn-helix domain-containing protein [Paenibacillus segetis]GGH18047.1 XRE family transcriptional regulator [Paenibacillus segetis]
MSDLGQQLKEARLAKGLSLDDVQEVTKIRKRYLEAIEAGDYKVLPGSFYVRAFIKTYAEAVGINADELLEEHSQHVPATVSEQQTMEPVLQKRRSRVATERNSKWLSTTLMWSFAVLILIVIYLYFTVWGNTDKPDDKQVTDPTKLTQIEKDPLNPDNSDSASGGNVQNGDNTEPEKGQNGSDNGNTGNTENTGNEGTDNGTDTDVPQDITVVPDGKDGSTTKFKVQNPGGAPVEVVITATGRSWMDIRKGDKNGEKLFFDTTADGDVLKYELGPEGIYIKSGASPYTTITVAGVVVEDGKNTSKIQLNLDSGENTNTEGTVE